MSTKQKSSFADKKMLGRAIKDSFIKLSPKTQAKNPVMFLVFVSVTFWPERRSQRLYAGDCCNPMVHCIVCQLCRGHRRGQRQGAG